ncbi:hypothetical protein GUJ93_ZPchr0002g23987 [Zizania palustris]|uniref:F-box associated beta-propeller type 3 domain-containing protein n=1 Tax=Zizania palustris TaxID=103762 RepID=A0A8J5RM64_ZIZPA|nr:hypothetical protein GUJ93_ZPchr0002g23987 [Zizania palustris]
MPTKPYHGLTLLCNAKSSAYYVLNLSTGEHVALLPCALADNHSPYGTDCAPPALSTGLGFDPVACEHKVVRLYQDLEKRPRCEVYSLGSGGRWRPCAGQVPEHATKGLEGRPPVFLDGCFYWHMHTGHMSCVEARMFRTPELILSLSASTEQFGWVHTPEELAPTVCHIVDHGSLCAVVDHRLTADASFLSKNKCSTCYSLFAALEAHLLINFVPILVCADRCALNLFNFELSTMHG